MQTLESSLSESTVWSVASLTHAKQMCVVLCCMNRSRAYCMSNTYKAFISDPINEGEGLERV